MFIMFETDLKMVLSIGDTYSDCISNCNCDTSELNVEFQYAAKTDDYLNKLSKDDLYKIATGQDLEEEEEEEEEEQEEEEEESRDTLWNWVHGIDDEDDEDDEDDWAHCSY